MDGEVLAEGSSIGVNGAPSYGTKDEVINDDKAPIVEMDALGADDDGESVDSKKEKKPKAREQFQNRFQYILSLVGYAVGLGNVWRFSYLTARNGGSAFVLVYLIMLFVLGIPLFYLEVALGQSVKKGPVKAWFAVSKNLGGIGVCALIVCSYICLYYNVIISWVFFYLFNSFHKYLPWGECFGNYAPNLDAGQKMELVMNASSYSEMIQLSSCLNASTEYFWYVDAVGASSHIGVVESFNWKLFLCLLLAWVVVYLCLFRGIQSSGKVIYFTATFPYVVLICLFFRAVTLEGAGKGLAFVFVPSDDWAKHFFSPQVWLEASTQIFFSLGVSIGALVALSSYSKAKYNNLTNSLIVCITNSLTSIFSSIIIFSIVGFRATQLNVDVDLVRQGPGLAFVVITEAILRMPGSPFWAVLFFIMLLTLGLDSQFATFEAVITVLYDIKIVKKVRKEIVVGILCIVFFIMSFPFVLGNGLYLFQLFDQFAGTVPLLLIGFFEFIAVGWVFGVRRFFKEFTNPYHKNLIYLWIVMWKWVGPITMLIIFVSSFIRAVVSPPHYSRFFLDVELDKYHTTSTEYPSWALFIGALIVLTSVSTIPIVLIVRLVGYQSAREEAVEFLARLYLMIRESWEWIKTGSWRRCCRNRNHLGNGKQEYSPYEESLDNSIILQEKNRPETR